MSNKPFEIQSPSLSLNGVAIDTSAQGKLVIPGITRAGTHVAIEVNDTGDQTETWTGTPVVIDGYTYYATIQGNQPIVGWTAAEYAITQLDGDGYIDGIDVVSGGAGYTGEAVTYSNVMFAAAEGTAIDSSTQGQWTEIPFAVRCGAGEITSEFGGSGGSGLVVRPVNFPYGSQGDTQGTIALDPTNNNVYVCTADYVSPGTTEFNIITSELYNITQDGGQDQMSATIALGDYPAIDTIMQAFGYQATGWQIDGNVILDGPIDCEAVVETGNRWGFRWLWQQGQPTSFPQGEEFTLTYSGSNSIEIWEQLSTGIANSLQFQYGGSVTSVPDDAPGRYDIVIDAEKDIVFNVDEDGKQFRFTSDGGLKFADGSTQTTAYTGQTTGNSDLYVMANVDGTIITSTDGLTWTNPVASGVPLISGTPVAIGKLDVHGGVIVYTRTDEGNGDGIHGTGLYYSTEIGTAILCVGTDSDPGGDLYWNEVHYFTDTHTWVAVGYSQYQQDSRKPIYAYGTDGINWTVSYVDPTFVSDHNIGNWNWEMTDVAYNLTDQVYVFVGKVGGPNYAGVFVTGDLTAGLGLSTWVDVADFNARSIVSLPNIDIGIPVFGIMLAINSGDVSDVWTSNSPVNDPNNWYKDFNGPNNGWYQDSMIDNVGYVPDIAEIAGNGSSVIITTVDGQVAVPVFNGPGYMNVSIPLAYTSPVNDIIRNDWGISGFTVSPVVGSQDTYWNQIDTIVSVGQDSFHVVIDADKILVTCDLIGSGKNHQVGDVITLPGNVLGGDAVQDAITITVTDLNVAKTTIRFSGETPAAVSGEKIVISGVTSHTENGTTTEQSYNGTYYIKVDNTTDPITYELYTDQACTIPWDTQTYWPVNLNTGMITWGHGQYMDAAGAANSYYFVGNDDEQIFRSSDSGLTWTQETDFTGMYFNDFGYGTWATAASNAELIGDGAQPGVGTKRTVLTEYRGFQGGENDGQTEEDWFNPADVVGVSAGDVITFHGGEVRTITHVDTVDNYTRLRWTGPIINDDIKPRFPLTIASSNYAEPIKATARIKPDNIVADAYGQYLDIYAGQTVSEVDNRHIHMKGHDVNVELFLGTDSNYVSTKEAGTTPASVRLHSENDVEVVNSNLRLNRKGSTWVSVYGDGENHNIRDNIADLAFSTSAVDNQGNLYVGGEHMSWSDALISKYGPDGNLIWSKYNDSNAVSGWQFDGVACNNNEVATLVQSDYNRSNNYYKLTVHDSDTGDVKSTTDIYDPDGRLDAYSMIYSETHGWTIVGRTSGEYVESPTLTSIGSTGVDIIELLGSDALLDNRYPEPYNNWVITGTNISGEQYLQEGTGKYKNIPITTVTGGGAGAAADIYVYYNVTGSVNAYDMTVTTYGSGYNTSDELKVLGSLLGGVDGGTTISAIPTGAPDPGNPTTYFFSKTDYPDLYNQLKWADWSASFNTHTYNVTAVRDFNSTLWAVDIGADDDTASVIGFNTVNGNDFLFDASASDQLYGYNSYRNGTPSKYKIRLDMSFMGYTGTDFRTSKTVVSFTDFPFADLKVVTVSGSTYLQFLNPHTDITNFLTNGSTVSITFNNGVSDVTITGVTVGGLVDFGGGGYPGKPGVQITDIGGTAPGEGDSFNVSSLTYPGNYGTYTLKRSLNSRPWVWTADWTRYLDPVNTNDSGTAHSVAEGPSGELVIGGYMGSSHGNAFVWKLNSDGTTAWIKTIDEDNNTTTGIAVSPLDGSIYATTDYSSLNKISSNGVFLARKQPYGPWGLSVPEVKVAVEEGVEYVYVGGFGGGMFTYNVAFMLNKLTRNLDPVWGRNLHSSYGSFYHDYDTLHTKLTLGQGQASLIGYTYLGSTNYNNALIWTISTTDDFVSHQVGNWNIQQNGWQVWGDQTGFSLYDSQAAGAKGVEATTLTNAGQDLAWNNYTFQSKVYNLNSKEQGLVGVEKIEFADGGTLDHNPGDIPPSVFFDPNNSWTYTLQLSDRGRFILNQTIPNSSSCNNLYIDVPLNQDVPFPVGTVITLINANHNDYRIYVRPVDYNSQWSPKIWATGYQNYSTWSFQGMQTATLMKISSNGWLLTANNITNED